MAKKKKDEEVTQDDLKLVSEPEEEEEDGDENLVEEDMPVAMTLQEANEAIDKTYPDAVEYIMDVLSVDDKRDPQITQYEIQCMASILQAFWARRLCGAMVGLMNEMREGRISGE